MWKGIVKTLLYIIIHNFVIKRNIY